MKKKLLELAKAVKETGVVEEVYKNFTAQGLKTAFNSFKNENKELIANIKQWKTQFKTGKKDFLFKNGEVIENAMEIALLIHLIKDSKVTEETLFENPNDLKEAILNIGNDMAIVISVLVKDKDYLINQITLKQICKFLEVIEQIRCECICDSVNLAEAEEH